MTMAKTSMKLALLALVASSVGCSFYARSPEDYRDETQKLLDTKAVDIKACYDAALQGKQDLQGKVTVAFTVEAETGKLKDVKVDPAGTTAPAELQTCVTNSVSGLALAPPDKRDGQAIWIYDFTAQATPPAG
jgi:hypothetical protein